MHEKVIDKTALSLLYQSSVFLFVVQQCSGFFFFFFMCVCVCVCVWLSALVELWTIAVVCQFQKQLIPLWFEIKPLSKELLSLNVELSRSEQRTDGKDTRVCVFACVSLNLQVPFGVSLQYLQHFFLIVPYCRSSHPLSLSLSLSLSLFVSLLSLLPSLSLSSSPSVILSVSFTLCLALVQVLAVVSFRKCTALCWEVRYLPLGQLPLFFFLFFFFW